MGAKFYSETNVNNTRKMACCFIDIDVKSRNYDDMTDSYKSITFILLILAKERPSLNRVNFNKNI